MSLQLWLPLNGNLENQGLNDMSFSALGGTTGLSVSTEGKIGSCYQRTAAAVNCYRSSNTINLSNDITMACWAYVSSAGTSANGLITNHSHSDCTGVGITVKQISDSDFRISCNTGDGTNRTYNTFYGTTNIKDAWHHLALTYSKSKQQLLLWVDGNIEYTLDNYSNASKEDYIDIFNWSTTHYASALYKTLCKLNDVRVYDHCLSPKEIKEISKCLILHYPMNQIDGIIGGRNLLKNSNQEWSNNHYLLAEYSPSASLIAGEKYTCTICVTPAMGVSNYSLYFSSGYQRVGNFYVSGTTKQIISITFIMAYYEGREPSSGSHSYAAAQFFRFPSDGTVTTNSTIHWVKITKALNDTSWTPAPEDTADGVFDQDNIVYDTSGYGNDGTMINAVGWSSDTVLGSGSYDFSSDQQVVTPTLPTNGLKDSYTIAYWANTPDFTVKMHWGFGDGNRLNLYNGTYWNTSNGTNNPFYKPGTTTVITAPSINVWHHYVITGDGISSKLYVDGVYYGIAKVYRPITGTFIYINGWIDDPSSPYRFNGLLNDYRIYATALSADDIKALYETRYSVADNGSLFCNELCLEGLNKENLLLTNITAGKNTTKIDDNTIMVGTGTTALDTYFYLRTAVNLKAGNTYTLSCDAENVPENCTWEFGIMAQSSGNILILSKNGRIHKTFVLDVDKAANTNFILDDIGGRPTAFPVNITLSNFRLTEGAIDTTPVSLQASGNLKTSYAYQLDGDFKIHDGFIQATEIYEI